MNRIRGGEDKAGKRTHGLSTGGWFVRILLNLGIDTIRPDLGVLGGFIFSLHVGLCVLHPFRFILHFVCSRRCVALPLFWSVLASLAVFFQISCIIRFRTYIATSPTQSSLIIPIEYTILSHRVAGPRVHTWAPNELYHSQREQYRVPITSSVRARGPSNFAIKVSICSVPSSRQKVLPALTGDLYNVDIFVHCEKIHKKLPRSHLHDTETRSRVLHTTVIIPSSTICRNPFIQSINQAPASTAHPPNNARNR